MPTPVITDDGLWNGRLLHFDSLPSTNSWAKERASTCAHGDIILADDQTAGRGRFDRVWRSGRGSSLTLSFIIDSIRFPFINRENYAQITALAVWQLLGGLKIEAKFKWPNDIMTERGKICGVLAEHISDTKVVIGIGVNISFDQNEHDFPAPYTSVHHEIDNVPSLPTLVKSLAVCLQGAFEDCRNSGLEHLLQTWKAHDYLKGKTVTVRTVSTETTGVYSGINTEGLLLLNVGGEIKQFHSGDVTLRSRREGI